jgi:acyl-CoA hydrolase
MKRLGKRNQNLLILSELLEDSTEDLLDAGLLEASTEDLLNSNSIIHNGSSSSTILPLRGQN